MSLHRLWEIFARAGADHSDDGMIALIPKEPQAWVIPGGEPPEELHVTIQYLSDISSYDDTEVKSFLDQLSGQYAPIAGRVMAHATFNADGGEDGTKDPCAVYLISDSDDMAQLASDVQTRFPDPEAHRPWLAHMTAGYGFTADQLSALGLSCSTGSGWRSVRTSPTSR